MKTKKENPGTLWHSIFKLPDVILNTKERLETYIRSIDESIENESDQSTIEGLIKFRAIFKKVFDMRIESGWFE